MNAGDVSDSRGSRKRARQRLTRPPSGTPAAGERVAPEDECENGSYAVHDGDADRYASPSFAVGATRVARR